MRDIRCELLCMGHRGFPGGRSARRRRGARPVGAGSLRRTSRASSCMTDIANEPDDQMSMVRFLVYSNQFDVEGLVATTSTWMKNKVRPDVIHTRDRRLRAGAAEPAEARSPGFPRPRRCARVVVVRPAGVRHGGRRRRTRRRPAPS